MRVLIRIVASALLFIPLSMQALNPAMFGKPKTESNALGDRGLNLNKGNMQHSMNRPMEQRRPDQMRSREQGFNRERPMDEREGMRPEEERRGPETPTHVVSGVDTDFREQEAIDHAVDTINAKSGGNWLLKRVWWEKTEEVYERIKEEFNKVMDTRMQFITEYNKLNRSLDIFYSEIGIEQGPLRDLLSHAQDLIEKEEKQQGYLNKREQVFVIKLKGKERDLEQLKLDIKAIQELDAKLDEAFEVLFKQIDVCNQYEQKAWDNFKEIARELNDKEARKLYYDTEGLYKDIQRVSAYISGAFGNYFHQTIESAHDHTTKISSQMNVLKNDGVDLVREAKILEQDEDQQPQKVVKKATPKKVKKGWWYSFGETVGRCIDYIINLIPESVRSWFGKEEKKVSQEIDTLKKQADQDFEEAEKDVHPYLNPVEKEVKRIEDNVFNTLTPGEQKELGIYDGPAPKKTPVQQAGSSVYHALKTEPTSAIGAMPTPPRPEKRTVPAESVEKKNPALAPVQHRPMHPPTQSRSITNHFQHNAPHLDAMHPDALD